jgi:hypothetical protein
MDDRTGTGAVGPALDRVGTLMQMGDDMVACGARRLGRVIAFRQALMQVGPQDIPAAGRGGGAGVRRDELLTGR